MDDDEKADLEVVKQRFSEKWDMSLIDAEIQVFRYHWNLNPRFCRRKIYHKNDWGRDVWEWQRIDMVTLEEDLRKVALFCRRIINAKAYDLDIDFTSIDHGDITNRAQSRPIEI